jgi:hypothetical protein
MIEAGFAKFQKQLRQAQSLFHLNEWVRSRTISLPSDAQLKVSIAERNEYSRYFDYSGALTRLYSTYENYVFSIISIWLRFLATTTYSCLSAGELKEVRERYRVLAGFCLQNFSQKRLDSIGTERLLFSTLKNFRGRAGEPLIPEVFYSNLNNLRLGDLVGLLHVVKLQDANGFLAKRRYLQEFLDGTDHSLDSYLTEFVQRRNEVAHGTAEGDLLGLSSLVALADFLEVLGRGVKDLTLNNLLRSNKCLLIGSIQRSYKARRVFVFESNSELISVTDRLIIQSGNELIVGNVESIQIEGRSLIATTPGQSELVGVVLSQTPPSSGKVFRVLSPIESFL